MAHTSTLIAAPARNQLPGWVKQAASAVAVMTLPGTILIASLKHTFLWVFMVRDSQVYDDVFAAGLSGFQAATIGMLLILLLACRGRDCLKRACGVVMLLAAFFALIVVWHSTQAYEGAFYRTLWTIRSSGSMEATLAVVLLAAGPWLLADTLDRAILRPTVAAPSALREGLHTALWLATASGVALVMNGLEHFDSYGLAMDWGPVEIWVAVGLATALGVAVADHVAGTHKKRLYRVTASIAPNFLLLLFVGGLLLQQRDVAEGPYTEYRANGAVEERGSRMAGKQHGQVLRYDSEGNLQSESWYWEGQLHGLYKRWDESSLVEQGAYCYDAKVGTWSSWQNGKLTAQEVFQCRYAPQISRHYFENGKLSHEVRYDADMVHGVETDWFENGQKSSETPLLYGFKHGVYRSWQENGLLHSELTFVLDYFSGEERNYDWDSGKLASTEQHELRAERAQLADALDPDWRK
ncbi:MAG: hypothetical protein H6839_11245 [Planctomycetes bacterium]|nr:hypothetical protein [Planctomycetota bacterium]